jgi:hypothetical protein
MPPATATSQPSPQTTLAKALSGGPAGINGMAGLGTGGSIATVGSSGMGSGGKVATASQAGQIHLSKTGSNSLLDKTLDVVDETSTVLDTLILAVELQPAVEKWAEYFEVMRLVYAAISCRTAHRL